MSNAFRLVNPVFDRNPYIFKVLIHSQNRLNVNNDDAAADT